MKTRTIKQKDKKNNIKKLELKNYIKFSYRIFHKFNKPFKWIIKKLYKHFFQ